MSVGYELVGDDEREVTIARLHDAYAAGRLTADELTQRLENAMTSRTQADLDAVLAGLSKRVTQRGGRGLPGLKPLLIAAGVVVLVGGAFLAGQSSTSEPQPPVPPPAAVAVPKDAAPAVPAVPEPPTVAEAPADTAPEQPAEAQDGGGQPSGPYTMSLSKAEELATVTSFLETKTAKGKFVVVTVMFKNVSKSPQKYSIRDDSARLHGPEGTEYQPDSFVSAGVTYNRDKENTAVDGLNPGLSAPVVLVFDVPKELTPKSVTVVGAEGAAGTLLEL
ncbi:DUF1707 domain-containing protein [Nonomuraea sp. NN258]|uniref:DUF1707 domain-containing protein n=1 Tax=Nonomuraea antri TaxID=2730852 RepID=UPI0015689250|nr:DUF1707 domain-containing protein [Nonomuraea antri]NRQ32617.1 DUF1707 domain-containing protein [Nonomuraea antri]